jgi:uncharacterized protein (TIGR03790 family)
MGILGFAASPRNASAQITMDQVVVLANKESAESVRVAKHYMRRREIPLENIIYLSLPQDDTLARQEYDTKVVAPIREQLEKRNLASSVRLLVTTYGIPLRIASPRVSAEEKNIIVDARENQKKARQVLRSLGQTAWKLSKRSGKAPTIAADAPDLELVKWADKQVRDSIATIKGFSDQQEIRNATQAMGQIILRLSGMVGLSSTLKPKEGSSNDAAEATIARLQTEIKNSQMVLSALAATPSAKNRMRAYATTEKLFGAIGVLQATSGEIAAKQYKEADASLDSELSLLWWHKNSYPLSGRVPNPYFYQNIDKLTDTEKHNPVMMVGRVDAPSAQRAIEMIDEAIAAEEEGLKGQIIIDSRGKKLTSGDQLSVYDQSLRDLAWSLRKETEFKVYHDSSPQTVEKGEQVALYVGWYRLRNYQDVFDFVPGAIAYHIASEEAVSIHDPNEKGWCRGLLNNGAAVTLGAVAEPYLDSFPPPRDFYSLIMSGRYSVIEAYYLSERYLSWRMAIFGDPLYNPFRGKFLISIKEAGLKESNGEDRKTFPTSPINKIFGDPVAIRSAQNESRKKRELELDDYFAKLEAQIRAQKKK